MGKDAASKPVMVLDEATPTAVGDIPIDNAEEQDCDAQVATEDLNKTADDAKEPIMAGIAEETTESCDDIASKPVMEKAEDSCQETYHDWGCRRVGVRRKQPTCMS